MALNAEIENVLCAVNQSILPRNVHLLNDIFDFVIHISVHSVTNQTTMFSIISNVIITQARWRYLQGWTLWVEKTIIIKYI